MRRRIVNAAVAVSAALVLSLTSCSFMTRDVWYSEYPAVTAANGKVYVACYEQGKRLRMFGNLVVLERRLGSHEWSGRRIPIRESMRAIGPSKSGHAPISFSVTPSDEMVVLFGTDNPYPASSAILVLGGADDKGRTITPPAPYTVFEGAVYANGRIYAVTRPLDEDTGPLYKEGKPVRTLLLELSMAGDVIRRSEIRICEPILHNYSDLNGFLPMAVAGSNLLIVENPGITSEVPDRNHVIQGVLRVVDLRSFAVTATIPLSDSTNADPDYSLFSDGTTLYAMRLRNADGSCTVFSYQPRGHTLRPTATVPRDSSVRLLLASFAVLDNRIYAPVSPRVMFYLGNRGKTFKDVPGLVEVGRIESAPASAPGK